MNERIQEQARQYANENHPGSFVKYDPEWFALYNKKFAELIVRECALVVHKKTGPKSALNVLEHFGVEE
jgi:meiotically up-regulated gene 157 (Mug157) protein